MENNIDELENDIKTIEDGASLKDKKEIASKYNCSSNKSSDIVKTILLILQKNRFNKSSFDSEDINDYFKLEPPAQPNKLKAFLANEPKEFVDYLKSYYFDTLKKYKLVDNTGNIIKRVMSPNEKYRVSNYVTISDYLKQFDSKEIKKKVDINTLFDKLSEKLEPFKELYLSEVENESKKFYRNIPDNIKKNESLYESICDKVEKFISDNRDYFYKSEYKHLNKWKESVSSKIKNYKAIIKYYTETEYIDEELKNARRDFVNNINALSERVIKKGLDTENIEVSNVKNDPKIFELIIQDGIKKIYARSILAAQYSDKMITHFRFILTETK